MPDIFNEVEEQTPSASYLEKFVGEGKKFRDIEELAKAYEHANNHIPELNQSLQETREFIASKLDEIAKQREVIPPANPIEEPRELNPSPAAPSKDGGEDLDARIKKALEESKTQDRLQRNADAVQEVLVERLGSVEKAVELVKEKAAELGVSPSFLKETAFHSPQAFFNLVGMDPAQKPVSSSTPVPSSDVNPRKLGETAVKPNTYKYYEQLRQSNPKLYWAPRTQMSLHKDAQENSEFFN